MAFQVFIEGARDSSPDGLRRLADAIADRYGLPLDSLLKRLNHGRFRVKKGVDQATARAFAEDLQSLGARCSVVGDAGDQSAPGGGAPAARAPAIPSGALRSAPPAARAPSVIGAGTPPPQAASPAGENPAAGGSGTPSQGAAEGGSDDYQSGLAAAFSGRADAQDLGALSQFSAEITPTDAFRLSSVDGRDDHGRDDDGRDDDGRAQATPEPSAPQPAMPAPGTSAPEPAAPQPESAAADPGFDPFAPPDAASDDHALELAVAQAPSTPSTPSAPPDAGAPAASASASASAPSDAPGPAPGLDASASAQLEAPVFDAATPVAPAAGDPGGTSVPAPARPTPRELVRKYVARSPQVRAVVGVFLVALVAFAPARLYWGSKVASAQAELNVAMAEEHITARRDSRAWEGLQEYGQEQLSYQRTRLSGARVTAILILLTFAAGLGFVWFRKVPWDRV